MKLVGAQVKLVIAIVFLYASVDFNMKYNNYAIDDSIKRHQIPRTKYN